jgi:hypothetical protein
LGLQLHIRKIEIFWLSYDGSEFHKGLFPSDIGMPLFGVKLLEGLLAEIKGFIEEVVMKRDVRVVKLIHLLSQLRDPQSELLLLWLCMSITKLFFRSPNVSTNSHEKGSCFV